MVSSYALGLSMDGHNARSLVIACVTDRVVPRDQLVDQGEGSKMPILCGSLLYRLFRVAFSAQLSSGISGMPQAMPAMP